MSKQEKKEVIVKEVKGTPFATLKKENGNYVLIMGKNIISEEFETYKKLKEYVEKKPWMLIATLACIAADNIIKENMKKEERKED